MVTLDAQQLHVELLHLSEGHVSSVHEPLDLSLLVAARGDAEVEIAIVIEEDGVRGLCDFNVHQRYKLSFFQFTDRHEVMSIREYDNEDLDLIVLVPVVAQGYVGAHVAVDNLKLLNIGWICDVIDVDSASVPALVRGRGHVSVAILNRDSGGVETLLRFV